jgi:serine protease Do
MITWRLKTSLASVAVVLLLSNCRAQDLSAQDHNALTQLSESLQQVITKVTPAIVTVEVAGYVRADDDTDDSDPAQHNSYRVTKAHSLGSGVILDANGYIITNAHVVDSAKQLRITIDEKLRSSHAHVVGGLASTVFDARIIGVFEEADLALVKIDATGLPTVPIANSDTVQPGQLVFAVGSPEGFKNSVSMGVISAVGRDSEGDGGASFIQTDAAMNPGSSGGALVDTKGDLVGITTFMVTDHGGNEGLGFALPSKLVQSIFQELKNTGHVAYGDIGIKVQNVTPSLARGLQISQDWGIIVSDLLPGSSAENAGLQVQDLVLGLDGHPLNTVAQFTASFYGKRVGDHVQLELLRGSRHLTLRVPVVEHATDQEKPPDAAGLERGLVAKLGVLCVPVNQPAPSQAKPLRSTSGVIVVAKLAGTDIKTELMSGDVIRSVNGAAVTSAEDLRSMMDHFAPGDSAVLQIERRHQFQYLPIDVD